MKNKLLSLSMYPAPYRVALLEYYKEEYQVDAFFETFGGDQREEEWFRKGDYHILQTEEGSRLYQQTDLHSYRAVLVFESSTTDGVKLILRCKRKKVPYVINCDGVILQPHGNFFKEALKRFLFRSAAGYLAGSEHAKQYFLNYSADEKKIFLHPFSQLEDGDILDRPLTRDEKAALRQKLGLPTDHRIAIAVGRFIPLKRYDKLIEQWKEMPEDCTLLLIGGGPEEETYRKIIKENTINNVLLHGFMQKEALFEYYKAADIFVHPTSYDVWGLVVNEAMACGLPVVISDHCVAGLELIRDRENGFLIPVGNDGEMCDRVREIFSDSALYDKMAQNVLSTIRPYTMSHMAQKQMNAIKEIIENEEGHRQRR